jgi:ferrous iron transport protein B
VIDQTMKLFGLSGRSFAPMLSGYACAVPAVMACRQISSKRERFLTIFILPLMSCSARLPVYALLFAFLFPESPMAAAVGLTIIYVASFIISGIISLIGSKFMKDNFIEGHSALMMELPPIRLPKFKDLILSAAKRSWSFVVNAGPIIAVLSIVIWVLSEFPTGKIETSYLADIGQFLEPIFVPIGLDWKVGLAVLSAFAAREVFVSVLASIVGGSEENIGSLISSLANMTFTDGTPVFTLASTMGLIVLFFFALQCMSTFATVRAELKSWKFAFFQLVFFNLLAYLLAVVTFQALSLV